MNFKFKSIGIYVLIINSINCYSQENKPVVVEFDNSSILKISGTTNVNQFDCILNHELSELTTHVNLSVSGDSMRLSGAIMEIPIARFDCDNAHITNDMHDALKVDEYPFMFLEALDICSSNDASDILTNNQLTLKMEIQLAGEKQCYEVEIAKTVSDEGWGSFSGEEQLDMRDFNIVPPKVALGLVQVNPLIFIKFKLLVKLVNKNKKGVLLKHPSGSF